jgi:hypothetical protein
VKTKLKITKEILIEDLVKELPESISYLMEQGIRCLRCGEPIWGSLESAAKEKGFTDGQINRFINDLIDLEKKK